MNGQSIVLRLAGPLQSWGLASQFNRRETDLTPTKSGIVGLLAAADGRRREDPIEDLVGLHLAVRTDQPGSLLRDYHTVSDFRGDPLLSTNLDAKGRQKKTSPKKMTHVTTRYYLEDAVFVVAIGGNVELLRGLASAIRRPGFPLALGRRSCVPAQPLLLVSEEGADLWDGDIEDVINRVPFQGRRRRQKKGEPATEIRVPVTIDDPEGDDLRADVPVSFTPTDRGIVTRRVRHGWVTFAPESAGGADEHIDAVFALLEGN